MIIAGSYACLITGSCRRTPACVALRIWTTDDPEVVRAALKRLDAAQTP